MEEPWFAYGILEHCSMNMGYSMYYHIPSGYVNIAIENGHL